MRKGVRPLNELSIRVGVHVPTCLNSIFSVMNTISEYSGIPRFVEGIVSRTQFCLRPHYATRCYTTTEPFRVKGLDNIRVQRDKPVYIVCARAY